MVNENWWSRLTTSDRTLDELGVSFPIIFLDRLFKLTARDTNIMREVKCGVLHFVSSSFILAVNPSLLEPAGFSTTSTAAATAICAGVSSIICGVFANMPFILAPTTSTSIYFCLFIQNHSLSTGEGKVAVFILGVLYSMCGIRQVAVFISNIIPYVIKVGVCLGVGLLIALEALTEIGLVRTGEHTVLDIGNFTVEIHIAMLSFVVIGLALHHKVRGAFLIGLTCGTALFWVATALQLNTKHDADSNPWPDSFVIQSGDLSVGLQSIAAAGTLQNQVVYRLVFDLYIIGVILLNGLSYGLAEMAGLKREDGSLPRGKWLYAACGVGTMLSAIFGSGPIMISPESAPGIKAGARTGLSSVICGCLFLVSTIFSPIFASTPSSGTSPVLLMIGMMLFENAKNVNWSTVKEALPVFLMAIFIPFTYSIFNGVLFGFGIYLILFLFTEQELFHKKFRLFVKRVRSCLSRNRQSNANYTSVASSAKTLSLSAEQMNMVNHSPLTTNKSKGSDTVDMDISSSGNSSGYAYDRAMHRLRPKLRLEDEDEEFGIQSNDLYDGDNNKYADDDDGDDGEQFLEAQPLLSFQLNEISASIDEHAPAGDRHSTSGDHSGTPSGSAMTRGDIDELSPNSLFNKLMASSASYEPLFVTDNDTGGLDDDSILNRLRSQRHK